MMFDPLIKRVGDRWRPSKSLVFYDKRDCEIGSCVYRPKKARETLRVVFLRALKSDEQRKGLFGDERYDYVAFVTNMGEHEMKNEDVVLWYRKRSDVENHIKELKGSFDLKHFPCQKLNANRAYGLIAAFAQNLVRYAAYIENPLTPHYAKVLRFRMLMLPVQVVKHARSVSFRFMTHHQEEIQRWLKQIKKQFGFVDTQLQASPPLFLN